MALVLCSGSAANAQSAALEVALKATYLVKFASFVEWPGTAFASPSSPLNLCIVGSTLAGAPDQAAAGQSAGGHPITVRHIAAAVSGAECHILFSAAAPGQSVDEALDAVRRDPVLTVTDLPAQATHKGVINFVLQSNHVRFQIDTREAAEHGLRLSSQLLALALDVTAR